MRDMPFPQKKEFAQAYLASAYSRDYLTVVEFEERVQALESAETYGAVEQLIADLPAELAPTGREIDSQAEALAPRWTAAVPGRPVEDQVLRGSGQVVRKRGAWLSSDRLVLEHRASTINLRFDQLADQTDVRLEVVLDIQGCTCRLVVPEGTRVSENVEMNASTFSVARKLYATERPDGPLLLLSGVANGSTIRVARLRG